jgi:hypothetical protein
MFKFFLNSDYPVGRLPQGSAGGTVKPCIHCKNNLRLSKWDSWNGFLVRCPHCRELHGKHMKAKGILWFSFFFNALSFFFTLRLKYALFLFSVFVVAGVFGRYLLNGEFFSQPLELFLMISFMFLPVLINGLVIAVHESDLRSGNKSGNKKKSVLELLTNVKDLIGP